MINALSIFSLTTTPGYVMVAISSKRIYSLQRCPRCRAGCHNVQVQVLRRRRRWRRRDERQITFPWSRDERMPE